MYKIGMIGTPADLPGFMALGFSVQAADTPAEASALLRDMVESGTYAVIFLVSDLAAEMGENLSRYKDLPLPAITVIPGHRGSDGKSIANLREAVKRAVGADILFKE